MAIGLLGVGIGTLDYKSLCFDLSDTIYWVFGG